MSYRDQNPMSYSARESAAPIDAGLRAFMLNVYNLMASALALTGLAAYFTANSPAAMNMLINREGMHPGITMLGWIVFLSPVFASMALQASVMRLSLPAAQMAFWAFSALMGVSLCPIFLMYTGESIVRVFFITSILFGAMGVWGYSSKRDLTSMGHFMYMGFIGIFLASIVNLFLQSSGLMFAVSAAGVVVFTGLIAYKTQQIKAIYYQVAGQGDMASRYAIIGALFLYISFINLFMSLLRLFGDRRN